MKLILALASLGLASAEKEYNVSVECISDNDVAITIAYDRPDVKMLSLTAGSCNATNAKDGFKQDNKTNAVTVTLNMRECGLRTRPRVTRDLRTITFNPTANIGLGRADEDGNDFYFYTSLVNLTCGVKDDYTVSLTYGTIKADYSGPDGITGGEKEYTFWMKSYNKDYKNETKPSNRAGDTVYLEIGSDDVVGKDYQFAVLNCEFVEMEGNKTVTTYKLFEWNEKDCKNTFLDFTIEATNATETKTNTYRISHTVFTFDPTRENDYTLNCGLKLCDWNVEDSLKICTDMEKACGTSVAKP